MKRVVSVAALVLTLAQLGHLPGPAGLRLLLDLTLGLRALWLGSQDRPRAGLLLLIAALDCGKAAEWSGQDCLPAILFLIPPLLCRSWRTTLLWASLGWGCQSLLDAWGSFGWMRPLPHAQPWGWPACPVRLDWLAVAGLAVAGLDRPALLGCLLLPALVPGSEGRLSRSQTRALLGKPVATLAPAAAATRPAGCDWLLVSNNPERLNASARSQLLLDQRTPAGHGRLLISHIQLGWPVRLQLQATNPGPRPAHLRRLGQATARDGARLDPGSWLVERFQAAGGEWRLEPGESVFFRLENLVGNGLLALEVHTDQPLLWRVSLGPPGAPTPASPVALREGQSRGLYLQPDRHVVIACPSGQTGWQTWHWTDPWLPNAAGEALLGNYGAEAQLDFEVQPGPDVELWLVARGGVLGAVDGNPGPLLAAGQARRLRRFGPGRQSLRLCLPANSFAPYSLAWRRVPR